MLTQWDIVGVPGDMWPWDESASDFFAIIVSSNWAREKAGIFWFCPVREGLHRVTGEGAVPIRQVSHAPRMSGFWKTSLLPRRDLVPGVSAPQSDHVRIPYERPIASMDLMITGGRH